jgi:hypothetical protein
MEGQIVPFLNDLNMHLLTDDDSRPTFALLTPFRYQTKAGVIYEVPEGFITDGASIPQIAMSVTGYPGMRAAVVHDMLVQRPELIDRHEADSIFHEALLECGVGVATAVLMYQGVSAYTDTLYPKDRTNEGGA